jgi:hypothetical protein
MNHKTTRTPTRKECCEGNGSWEEENSFCPWRESTHVPSVLHYDLQCITVRALMNPFRGPVGCSKEYNRMSFFHKFILHYTFTHSKNVQRRNIIVTDRLFWFSA